MTNEPCVVSGMQCLEIPPQKLFVVAGRGHLARLWILSCLEPCIESAGCCNELERVRARELFSLAFSLAYRGIQSSMAQAKRRLNTQWHRILGFALRRKEGRQL